jgi:hypothetical protein
MSKDNDTNYRKQRTSQINDFKAVYAIYADDSSNKPEMLKLESSSDATWATSAIWVDSRF